MICELTGKCPENNLYYDINNQARELMHYHGGQWCPIYSVGSTWISGGGIDGDTLRLALDDLERHSSNIYPEKDEALEILICNLGYQLNPF